MLDEREKERAAKALKLNGFDSIVPSLYPIGDKVKPTIRIKRLKHSLPFSYLLLKQLLLVVNCRIYP